MSTSNVKLSAENLQAGYGDVQVLWDVSLTVERGEMVCIVGSNGAGKSTFLRCASGLLGTTGGRLFVDGQDMAGAAPEAFLRRKVAHVPEGRRLFRAMSVRDNLLMGAYLRDDAAEIRQDLEKVYEIFPILAERRDQYGGTLSGGEQQMCAIGRGIMGRPELLMIDELSLGLAPRAVELLISALQTIRASGTAILLIEQDVMTALELTERAYVMDRGRVVKAGASAAMADDPAIRDAYMGQL
jgi:branched-chain amino acid transport system ATP-binding protein